MMPRLICPLCPFERTSHLNFNLTEYLKHIQLFHSHQPSFSITCGLGGCLRTFRNFQVYRNHVSTFHKGDQSLGDDGHSSEDELSPPTLDGDDRESAGAYEDSDRIPERGSDICAEELQETSALFLMGLKEKHKLTQTSLQGIIEGVTGLMQCRMSVLQSAIQQQLKSTGVQSSVIATVDALFDQEGSVCRPFHGLETQHQQMNFYRTHFNLIVSCYIPPRQSVLAIDLCMHVHVHVLI